MRFFSGCQHQGVLTRQLVLSRARTTCLVGVGLAGWFWQRPGKVGSGKETEVGLPLSYLQFFQLWVYFQLYFQNMSCFNIQKWNLIDIWQNFCINLWTTLSSPFMRFRIMRFSIYAEVGKSKKDFQFMHFCQIVLHLCCF